MVSIRFIVPSDWTSDQKGAFFETEIGKLLSKMRYKIISRIRFTGMEIDVLATNIDTGQTAFAECKFTAEKLSAGVITDILGKALIKNADIAYLFSTSYLGKEAEGVIQELICSPLQKGPVFAYVGPSDIGQMYLDVLNVDSIENKFKMKEISDKQIGTATLVISPDQDFWVIEHKIQGIPDSLAIIPVKEGNVVNVESVRAMLDDNKLWLGLKCQDGSDWIQDFSKKDLQGMPADKQKEIISQIPVADQFDDYRPCNPEDFVGRRQLQKDHWDFFSDVVAGKTKTRIISLVGQSGFGKSSLILKLADRFKNVHWKKKFFIFHVDTRSATSPIFIVEAILKGFNEAKNHGFIQTIDPVAIDSIDSPFSSDSMNQALSYLKSQDKLLIIFFDQFEELFIKEELLFLFENFRKLSFEIDELQENLVLGCSWRTGISLPEDHPAYHMWHELRDRRKEFRIEKFDGSEMSQQLQLLSQYLREPLENQLRRKLIDHCAGFPWLLKKFCIHIYRQIKKGVSQTELITSQFNIKQLFDEDSAELSESQISCLKYTAINSPIDSFELSEKYGEETVNALYAKRLIIRTGHKFAIYWDIFRDYLISGKLPIIPLTSIPTSSLSSILRAIQLLNKYDSLTKEEIAKHLGFTYKATLNIMSDLITFLLIRKSPDDKYQLVNEIKNSPRDAIAAYLYIQLKDHKVIFDILDREGQTDTLSIEEFKQYIVKNYSHNNLSAQSVNVYAARLLQWFTFCGITEQSQGRIKISKTGQGVSKGLITDMRGKNLALKSRQPSFFLCSSSPTKLVKLISIIVKNGDVTRSWIDENGFRNSLYDGSSLGIIEWNHDKFVINAKFRSAINAESSEDEILGLVKKEVLNAPFIKALLNSLSTSKSLSEIGEAIALSLERKWTESSIIRYITAGKTWLKAFQVIARPQRPESDRR